MNRRYSALALSALALGAAALSATEASAMQKDRGPTTAEAYEWPDEGSGYPGSEATSPPCSYANHPMCKVAANERPEPGSAGYNYPSYNPQYEVATAMAPSQSDDNGVKALQAGASALGGAGVACGGTWLYRRRNVPAS